MPLGIDLINSSPTYLFGDLREKFPQAEAEAETKYKTEAKAEKSTGFT